MMNDFKNEWNTAMDEEIKTTPCQIQVNRKQVGFKIKTGEHGEFCILITRLVAQGFLQKFRTDYNKVFAKFF